MKITFKINKRLDFGIDYEYLIDFKQTKPRSVTFTESKKKPRGLNLNYNNICSGIWYPFYLAASNKPQTCF